MTDKEHLKKVMAIANKNIFIEVYYKNSDSKIASTVKSVYDKVLEQIKESLDWNDIDKDTCRILGFGKWDDDSNLYLIPAYMYPIIPIGLKVTTILDNEEEFNGKNDTDSRFGCLAFGIKIKE